MMPRVQLITNRLGARTGEFSMLPQIDDVACHYRGTRRPAGQPCQHENELVLTCREHELERAEALAQQGTMVQCYGQTARTSETGGTAMAWMNSAIDAQVSPAHLIVRRIGPADLRDGLAKGLDDFVAMIVAIFFVWLGAAMALDQLTLGRWVPPSSAEFVRQVFTTSSGWTLIIVGCGIGFLFAVVSLTSSWCAVPLLLDRDVGFATAVRTSVRAVLANPMTMAIWGLFVAAALVIGSLPLLFGLAIVLPILGHSTWHLSQGSKR